MIHIPVNIISMGIIDLLTGGLLWFFIVKKKKWQRYEFAIDVYKRQVYDLGNTDFWRTYFGTEYYWCPSGNCRHHDCE